MLSFKDILPDGEVPCPIEELLEKANKWITTQTSDAIIRNYETLPTNDGNHGGIRIWYTKITRPTTLFLYGKSGSGKTETLKRMSKSCRMKILSPLNCRIDHLPQVINWGEIDCLAVDDLSLWDWNSLIKAIPAYEEFAYLNGKTLILSSHKDDDLQMIGIVLRMKPALTGC